MRDTRGSALCSGSHGVAGTPVLKTGYDPVASLMESGSCRTGMPPSLYVDAHVGLLSSLPHKALCTQVVGLECCARYSVAGTAQAGSGESPAFELLKQALFEVLTEHPEFSPGHASDRFHIQLHGTHVAVVHKLKHILGYQFIVVAEEGPLLCPSWLTRTRWNQSTHMNVQRYVGPAYGGSVPRDIATDRRTDARHQTT